MPSEMSTASDQDLRHTVEDLKRQLGEAHQREAATADVLKIISRSISELEPVFDTIVETARRLCGAEHAILFKLEDGKYRVAATNGTASEFIEFLKENPITPGHGTLVGRTVFEARTVYITDALSDPTYNWTEAARRGNFRSDLGVPLLREGVVIGVIVVVHSAVSAFTDRQVRLVETFADQAVIAIENARLFKAEQARTRELAEALQHQTASAEILRTIAASPGSIEPVYAAMLKRALHHCDARLGVLLRHMDGVFHTVAHIGLPLALAATLTRDPIVPSPGTGIARAAKARGPAQTRDIRDIDAYADPEAARHDTFRSAVAELGGGRSAVSVPLIKDGALIGMFVIFRLEVLPFTDKQIELVTTFADQAVIAIENTRLFEEVQARTRELQESLEYQTATSEVLNVISRSPSQLQPVLDTIVETAGRLCGADYAIVFKLDEGKLSLVAVHGVPPDFVEFLKNNPPALSPDTLTGRTVLERRTVYIEDTHTDPRYKWQEAADVETTGRHSVCRCCAKARRSASSRSCTRQSRALPPSRSSLSTTFADQAVIAIENARLFEEVQARTRELEEALEQQTATSDILRVISGSPTDIQPVFDAIASTAARLCDALDAMVLRLDGDTLRLVAHHGPLPAGDVPLHRGTLGGRTVIERRLIHVEDLQAEGVEFPEGSAIARQRGHRTTLSIPLIREGAAIGNIQVRRNEIRLFTDKQIALLQTFADQAVIAIENTRLFEEVQARTRELQELLEYQTATSDVLGVISRSPTEVQPVFDAIVASAARLCEAEFSAVTQLDGELLHLVAVSNMSPEETQAYQSLFPRSPNRGFVVGRAFVDGVPVQVEDVTIDPDYDPKTLEVLQRAAPYRTYLGIPILRHGVPIGTIGLGRRQVRPFTSRQIELVQTFADQAVIAIENTRLFKQVQARTRELSESLEYQTATSDVLGVISRSPSQIQPVLDTIVETAGRLCDAHDAIILLREDEWLKIAAHRGPIPVDFVKWPIGRNWTAGRSVVDRKQVHVHDLAAAGDEFPEGHAMSLRLGHRTILSTPLLREDEAIGTLVIRRDRGAAVLREANRAAPDLCRPGGDRHRERAAVRGGTGTHA